MIRVLVAARSSVVRAGLESVVRASSSLELAGALDTALLSSAEFQADILLLDAADIQPDRLPGFTEDVSLPVVMLLDTSDAALLNSALRSGVRAVISREAAPEEIESAIQAVNAGLIVIASESLPDLLLDMRPVAETLAEPLSERELEVLDVIAEGLSNKLIAHRLGISEHTVKTHVASILAKLGAASRTEAVSLAIRRGLVML
ncbi:MAG TPA: response regulator transcription factor [Bryobacteraceae bacterium]